MSSKNPNKNKMRNRPLKDKEIELSLLRLEQDSSEDDKYLHVPRDDLNYGLDKIQNYYSDAELENVLLGVDELKNVTKIVKGQTTGSQSKRVERQATESKSKRVEGHATGSQSKRVVGNATGSQSKRVEGHATGSQSKRVEGQASRSQSKRVEGQAIGSQSNRVKGHVTGIQSKRVERQVTESDKKSNRVVRQVTGDGVLTINVKRQATVSYRQIENEEMQVTGDHIQMAEEEQATVSDRQCENEERQETGHDIQMDEEEQAIVSDRQSEKEERQETGHDIQMNEEKQAIASDRQSENEERRVTGDNIHMGEVEQATVSDRQSENEERQETGHDIQMDEEEQAIVSDRQSEKEERQETGHDIQMNEEEQAIVSDRQSENEERQETGHDIQMDEEKQAIASDRQSENEERRVTGDNIHMGEVEQATVSDRQSENEEQATVSDRQSLNEERPVNENDIQILDELRQTTVPHRQFRYVERQTERIWTQNVEGFSEPSFDLDLGPTKQYTHLTQPVEYFDDLFPSLAIELLVTNTNNYAVQKRSKHWVPVSTKEIRAYLGVIILMGLHPLPNIELYWSTDEFYRNPTIAAVMSCKRFKNDLFPSLAIELLVTNTNNYAVQKRSKHWVPVTTKEIRAYLGVIILMGLHPLPNIELYWSTDEFYRNPTIAAVMSCKRFKKITENFHVSDNSRDVSRGQEGYDKLCKVRPLITILNQTFQENARNSQHQSIDESMIKFKGRSSLRQYMPLKPIKRGYKAWARCDSKTSYLYQFDIYTGKSDDGLGEGGLGFSVVTHLSENLPSGTLVAYDNFFSSLPLAEALFEKGIYTVGTFRPNRKGIPDEISNKPKRRKDDLKPGEFVYSYCPPVAITKWKDSKDVFVMTTAFNPRDVEQIARTQKDGSKKPMFCPKTIAVYEKHGRSR